MDTPDWKNESDYDYTNHLTLEGWAWEFLRRKKDYIKAYKAYRSGAKSLKDKHGDTWNKVIVDYTPYKNENESLDQWGVRCLAKCLSPKTLTLREKYGLAWGLRKIHNPKHQYCPNKIQFIKDNAPRLIETHDEYERFIQIEGYEDEESSDYFETISKNQSLFLFDLTQPIPDQIKKATEILNNKQSALKEDTGVDIEKRKRPEKWTAYLRVLDAYNENPNASKIELGKLIGTSADNQAYSDTGHKALKAAETLQDNYQDLLNGTYKS